MKKTITLLTILFVLTSSNSYSQFTALHNFTGSPDGGSPRGSLISVGTFLYGMTELGGTNNLGTIFKIKPDGTGYVKLLDFDGTAKGSRPKGSLYYDGTFLYGMTSAGGINNTSAFGTGIGTIFKIKPDGSSFIKIFDFTSNSGNEPQGSLISDGTFLYGMTNTYGVNGPSSRGTVFKIKPDGTNFVVLYSFPNDGNGGPIGSFFYDGTFLYGSTYGTSGSLGGGGTVFKIKTDGTGYVILKSFISNGNIYPDGKNPVGHLISDGTFLYGMTQRGGTNEGGTIFKIQSDGTNFQVIMNFGFNGSSVMQLGNQPTGSLFYDGSTYLYGMNGGPSVLFKINRDGTSIQKLSNLLNGQAQGNYLISDGTFLYGMDSRSVFKYCNISAPTGITAQNFTQGQTLSNLQVTGTNLIWYLTSRDALNDINPIANSTLLVNGRTYYVTQANDGCKSPPLAITVTLTLDLNNFIKDDFKCYPNPVKNIVNFENNNTILKITLFNLLGQVIQEKEINSLSGHLDMSNLPIGNYSLKVKTNNGESNIKLVKN
jgi:uncharacterized repeat protein (TIGR03803 family)